MLKVSIVTVCYNSASTIRWTLESVRNQKWKNIEHIVIDGGSTDGTLEVVREFPHVSHLISEKDNGIYHAMNKGIDACVGEVILFLNSDDLYYDSTVISDYVKEFANPDVEVIYSNLVYVNSEDIDKINRRWIAGRYEINKFKYGWMPPHPTFAARRDLYVRFSGYNTDFNTAADYELMLRFLYKNRVSALYLNRYSIRMRSGGVSNRSMTNRIRANVEDRKAWKVNNLSPKFYTLYMKPLRKLYQFL